MTALARTGTTATALDLFPKKTYNTRNGNLLPAASGHLYHQFAYTLPARARAEEMLRLLRHHADDIGLVLRLIAKYGSIVRTSLPAHEHLTRMQRCAKSGSRSRTPEVGLSPNGLCWR